MKVAVVAHYDSNDIWDENFLLLVQVLTEVMTQVIIVTTSDNIENLPIELSHILLIRRPNIGYDFYSYRVGIHLALSEFDVEGLLILNSSIILLDKNRFRKLLLDLTRDTQESPILAVTSSLQISWHLQSYFLYFNQNFLPNGWVHNFFSLVEPTNSKFEVIVRYEIGLGKLIQKDKIPCETLFKPNLIQIVRGSIGVLKSLSKTYGLGIWKRREAWLAWHEINWTHFGAEIIARQFGLVKAEFLRSNPHQLPQQPIWNLCNTELYSSIKKTLHRTHKNYKIGEKGITELNKSFDSLDIIKQIVEGYRYRQTHTRIAVVVHLFYVNMFDEILNYLENILEPFDIFVSTPFEGDIPYILDRTDHHKKPVTVVLTKNKGRDVGPFIALFRSGHLDSYEIVLKLHSKKSSYSDKGEFWRRKIYTSLCGSSLTVLRSLHLLRENNCGLIGPSRYFLTHPAFWGANRDKLSSILYTCGIKSNSPHLAFFAGTMFWFRPNALALIHKCTGEVLEFEPENGEQDGLLAHAWERAFCIIARSSGYSISAVELCGKDIFDFDATMNQVPVL